MPDAFTSHYLNDALTQFRQMKDLADRAMAQIGDDDLFIALDEDANSIAVLLKHTAGSMRERWTAFPANAEGTPGRDRDREFVIEEGDSARSLRHRWEAGWQCLFDAFDRLTPEDVTRTVSIRGKPLSVVEAINRQLTHYAYHVGQIVFLAKHLRSGAWQSLSIPRGKSAEFTAAARRNRAT
jgi:hypothetical protein